MNKKVIILFFLLILFQLAIVQASSQIEKTNIEGKKDGGIHDNLNLITGKISNFLSSIRIKANRKTNLLNDISSKKLSANTKFLLSLSVKTPLFSSNMFKFTLKPVQQNFDISTLDTDKEILIAENMDQELIFDYDTYLTNEKGAKIYFYNNNGSLIIYTTIKRGNKRSLLTQEVFNSYPLIFQPSPIYSNGEQVIIQAFDESNITAYITNVCTINPNMLWCSILTNSSGGYYKVNSGILEYYLNNSLFQSNEIRDNFVNKITMLDNLSISFLKENMGFFPPIDKLIQIRFYNPEFPNSFSGANNFYIQTYYSQQISEHHIQSLQYGNTHEFVHIFLTSLPVKQSWFEEGLADYMAIKHEGQLNNILCTTTGWRDGYYNENGNFIGNSPFVQYSNFTTSPKDSEGFYSPLSRHSYYRSAICFWRYIDENYGSESLKEVVLAWQNTRTTFPPIKKWLIKDIVNPTLNINLSQLIYDRYSYLENS